MFSKSAFICSKYSKIVNFVILLKRSNNCFVLGYIYVIYSCDVKVNFQKPLFQSSVARDSIINVENNCAA